jgi:hypothetical protein
VSQTTQQPAAKQLVANQPVKYVSLGIIESMKFTRLVGLFDKATPPKIGRRKAWKGSPKQQKRYIIEHLYGFFPSDQPLLRNHPMMKQLDLGRKYAFAYHDELFPLSPEEYDELERVQRSKSN